MTSKEIEEMRLGPQTKVYIIFLIGLIFLGLGTWACPDSSKTTTVSDLQSAIPSEPEPRQKPDLLFSLRVYESSGAVSEFSLNAEAEFEIEPAQKIEVVANQQLADFRVRLMDAQERVLPSDEEIVTDANGTRVNIQPLSPLKAAHSLILLVDSQLAHQISNRQGDVYDDFRVSLKVRGEPEKPILKPPFKTKPAKKKLKKRAT